jgi:hypothetical protein
LKPAHAYISYFPDCPNIVMHFCHANCASDEIDTDPCTPSCNYCFRYARHWPMNFSTVIYIVMHTVMGLVLPMCSTLFHDNVYWHSHHHTYYHAISTFAFQHWSKIRFFYSSHYPAHYHAFRDTLIHTTVSRHSHGHAHCHTISASVMFNTDTKLFHNAHIVIHIVMWLVFTSTRHWSFNSVHWPFHIIILLAMR